MTDGRDVIQFMRITEGKTMVLWTDNEYKPFIIVKQKRDPNWAIVACVLFTAAFWCLMYVGFCGW